jgi:hypothetical protein
MSDEKVMDVDLTTEELEDLDRAWAKYLAEIEAKKAAQAERRNAKKRADRAAKKTQ